MSTTGTAAGHGDGGSQPSPAGWSELPDDILGMVRLRINSPRDRVHIAAVCRSWRDAASRLPATPAVPALILSPRGSSSKKHLCGSDGSWAMRVPSKAVNKRYVGFYQGGWIAATDDENLAIINLFSGAEVALSPEQSKIPSIPILSSYDRENYVKKIIFSQDPSSSDGCTLAVLRVKPNGTSVISVCGVGCPDGRWSERLWRGDIIRDIAFFNGELYGLEGPPEILVRFEITMMEDGAPVITDTHRMDIQGRHWLIYEPMEYEAYIVELHGKLSMALRSGWLPKRRSFFKVFELVDASKNKACYKYRWSEVRSFGEHALFLGWSKAIHVPVGGLHGIKRNHIYFCKPDIEDQFPNEKVYYSVTSGDGDEIYCREERIINDGVGRTGYYWMNCYNNPMWRDRCNSLAWIYPPDF